MWDTKGSHYSPRCKYFHMKPTQEETEDSRCECIAIFWKYISWWPNEMSFLTGRKLIFCWFTNRSSPYWSGWSGNHQTFPELVAVHVNLPAFIYTWGILDWNNIEELSTVWLSDGSLYWNNKGENLVIASSSVPVDWNYCAIRGSELDSIPKASVLECSSTEWCQLDWSELMCTATPASPLCMVMHATLYRLQVVRME